MKRGERLFLNVKQGADGGGRKCCPAHSDACLLEPGWQTHALYRASHVLEDWVLLTWIWNVPPPYLGSR